MNARHIDVRPSASRRLAALLALTLTACAGPRDGGDSPGSHQPAVPVANPAAAETVEPTRAGQTPASASSDEISSELAALEAEYKAADRAFWESLPRGDDGSPQLGEGDAERMPSRVFVPRFHALAERAEGTAAEVDALLALLEIAGSSWWPEKDVSLEAETVQALLERHGDSPRMTELAGRLRFMDHVGGIASVDAGLARLADSPHAAVRAVALKAQAERLLERDGTEDAAREVLARLQREHPDSEPAQEAAGLLFMLDNLRVGLVAPDQEAVDQDGETFRLSDYRGKVVLLVFWGFW